MGNLSFFVESLIKYQFLQNALLAGILVGIACSVLGCFIMLRGMALMGDAISHAVLPGVAFAYILGFNFFTGAAISGVFTSLIIGCIVRNSKLKDDAATGIAFTGAFALGVVMITSIRGSGVDLWHILFGNVLAVSRTDLIVTLGLTAVVLAGVFLFYKQLLLTTFDPLMAQAIGMPVRLIHYLLMVFLSLVTVSSLKTVGIILVVAMLVTPGATAFLLASRLPAMLALAAFFGVLSSLAGVYFSYLYDLATGASIVLVASILFTLCFFFSPKQGFLGKLVRTRFRSRVN